jgi:predicted phage-related endonuclease
MSKATEIDYLFSEDDWFEKRLGRLTSSRFGDMMQRGRAKDQRFGTACKKYINEKIAEILTGQSSSFSSQATDWGTDLEPEAINFYQSKTGNIVDYDSKRFVEFGEYAGGSPDGLIGEDGAIEIKCPFNSINHIETIRTNGVPKQYAHQVQGHLMVTGREWCDFVSYDPRIKDEGLRMHIIRVERDQDLIDEMEARIEEVRAEIDKNLTDIGYKPI